MVLFGSFLANSIGMKSKPGVLLCGYLCMRYLPLLDEKDLTDSEG